MSWENTGSSANQPVLKRAPPEQLRWNIGVFPAVPGYTVAHIANALLEQDYADTLAIPIARQTKDSGFTVGILAMNKSIFHLQRLGSSQAQHRLHDFSLLCTCDVPSTGHKKKVQVPSFFMDFGD